MQGNDRMFDVSQDFEFIASMLVQMIGHKCNCGTCTERRQRAVAAFMWLCANATPAQVSIVDRGDGTTSAFVPVTESINFSVPAEIVELARRELNGGNMSADQRAVINGFLTRIEGDDQEAQS